MYGDFNPSLCLDLIFIFQKLERELQTWENIGQATGLNIRWVYSNVFLDFCGNIALKA